MKKLLVVLAVLGLAVAFTGTAMAADWNFYGNARMETYWVSTENKVLSQAIGAPSGAGEDTELLWDLQGNSRIGAKVKHGDISGYFEYGTGVNVRKLYGTWDFGAGQLLVGQTYTPSTFFYAGQAYNLDDGFFALGQPYAGRQPMLALHFSGDWGLFKFAAIKNSGDDDLSDVAGYGVPLDTVDPIIPAVTESRPAPTVADTERKIPKLELSYSYKADVWFLDATAGYQTYEIEGKKQLGQIDDSVDSYLFGVGGGVNFGGFYGKLFGFYGQNLDQYGMGSATFDASGRFEGGNMLGNSGALVSSSVNPFFDPANPLLGTEFEYKIKDTNSWGGLIVLGYKINDMVTLELGGSMNTHDPDPNNSGTFVTDPLTGLTTNLKYDDDTAYGGYLQAVLTLADGMFLVPEIGMYDLDDTILKDKEEGDRWYVGAKWQINF